MKINADRAVTRQGQGGVATMIFRDHNDLYLGSATVVFSGTTDPTVLEAYMCRKSLALVEDLGLQRICIASDCQGIVNDFDQGTGGPHGAIIHEITERNGSFQLCNFIFLTWELQF